MTSASELSNLIKKNSGNLLDIIDIENIRTWVRLNRNLQQVNAGEDPDFQEAYRKFFGIGGVGMNKAFVKRYFEILEEVKSNEELDLRHIVLNLMKDQVRRKLSLSQFSAVTKMANLINADFPIYDSHISELYEFDKPTSPKMDNRERLNIYLTQYQQQVDVFNEILNQDMIHDTMVVFKILLKRYHNEEFPSYDLPKMKKMDFILSAIPRTDYRLVT